MDKTTIEDLGYDWKMQRKGIEPVEKTEDITSSEFPRLGKEQVALGMYRGKKLNIDWDKGLITVNVPDRSLVQMGDIDNVGRFGFQLKDLTGNLLFEASTYRRYYGITGTQASVNQSTDVTVTSANLQSTIDLVHEAGGGIVFLEIGNYTLNQNITLYDSITIKGEDRDLTVISFSGDYGFRGTGLTSVTIQDLTLRDSTGNSVQINNSTRIKIENVFFYNNGEDIVPTGNSIIEIKYCISSLSNYFIDSNNDTELKIDGNTIDTPSRFGAFINNATLLNITNNVLEDIINEGFHIGSSDTVHFIGNSLASDDATNLLHIPTTMLWGTVADNLFIVTGTVTCIYASSMSECSITGNVCDGVGNVGTAYDLSNTDKCVFSNNVATDFSVGATIDNTSDRMVITGNILYQNTTNLTNNATNSQTANNITA